MIEKRCKICNKKYNIYPYQKDTSNYCSRNCQYKRDTTGLNNPKWRGGKIKRGDGRVFVYAPHHPNAKFNGTHILEYRLIAEQITGRPLYDNEIVHHIDGNVLNNNINNLQVITQSEHALLHSHDRRDLTTGRFRRI